MRKWRENEEMERDSLSTFSLISLYFLLLSIPYIKQCLILSQYVKYAIFVANVTKRLTYALRENNSGSNSLRESSASCAGLSKSMNLFGNVWPIAANTQFCKICFF